MKLLSSLRHYVRAGMAPLLVFAAAPTVAVVNTPASVTVQASSACRSTTDSNTIVLQNYLISIATGTDSGSIRRRTTYNIPKTTSAGKVTIVNSDDTGTCRRARAAYATALGSDTTSIPAVDVIFIWSAGAERYVVADYQTHAGEFRVQAVFDTSFTYLAGIAN